jgi:hypothetical protein
MLVQVEDQAKGAENPRRGCGTSWWRSALMTLPSQPTCLVNLTLLYSLPYDPDTHVPIFGGGRDIGMQIVGGIVRVHSSVAVDYFATSRETLENVYRPYHPDTQNEPVEVMDRTP